MLRKYNLIKELVLEGDLCTKSIVADRNEDKTLAIQGGENGKLAPIMASVGQLPLGRGEFCTSLAPTPALSVKIRQPLSREDFCLPCTSLAPALLGRTLCRKSPSGTILRAEVNVKYVLTQDTEL